MNKIRKYIKTTHTVIVENKETLLFNNINVFIKDPLPDDVYINNVLGSIEMRVPSHLVSNIEAVYVGHFKEFDKKDTNAFYQDGALYISNQQDDDEDMVDDIIHEISHAVEEKYGSEIYGDGELEREFLQKRKRLADMLAAYGYADERKNFMNTEYSVEFDNLLYRKIGYEKLQYFTIGLFPNNYSVTALREYFGTGFEKYFLNQREELRETSPILYNKIKMVDSLGEM